MENEFSTAGDQEHKHQSPNNKWGCRTSISQVRHQLSTTSGSLRARNPMTHKTSEASAAAGLERVDFTIWNAPDYIE